MVGAEGEMDLDASDAGLGVEVGEGGSGGGTSDGLGPAVDLLGREGVGPGAMDGDAEVDNAVFIYVDDGDSIDHGCSL